MFFAKNIVNLLSKNIDRVGKSIHTPKNCHIRNRYRYIYSGWIDCPFPFFSSKPGNDSYVPSNTTHTTTVTRRRPPTSSIDSRHAYSTSHPTSRGRETFLRWSMKTTTTTTKERRIKKTIQRRQRVVQNTRCGPLATVIRHPPTHWNAFFQWPSISCLLQQHPFSGLVHSLLLSFFLVRGILP